MLATKSGTKAIGDLFGDENFWDELKIIVLEEMAPVFKALLEAGAESVVAEKAQAVEASMSTVDVLLANVIPEYSDNWWNQIETTTQTGLRNAISDAVKMGEPVDKVIKDITPLFGEKRAEAIAVTETTRLFAKGAEASYQAAGVERVLWRTVKDVAVCPICRGYAENKEGWPLGQGPKPPAHVGCRCFLSPMTLEEHEVVVEAEAEVERPKKRASRAGYNMKRAEQIRDEHFSRGVNVKNPGVRGVAKKRVRDDITERMSKDKKLNGLFNEMGLTTQTQRRDWVNHSVGTWAKSSSDSEIASLCLQKAAMEEFGVGKKAYTELLKQVSSGNRILFNETWRGQGNLYRGFTRAMYENTQEQLASQGITELAVFRGFAWYDKKKLPGWSKRIKSGDTGTTSLNPLSSFSVDAKTAHEFAEEGDYALVIRGTVPASRVISTARTGLGCLNEFEAVVLDGPGNWEVVKSW